MGGEREQRYSVTKMVKKNGLLLLEVFCGQDSKPKLVKWRIIYTVVIDKNQSSSVKIDPVQEDQHFQTTSWVALAVVQWK